MEIKPIIQRAITMTASDLHLIVGMTPMVRVAGDIRPMEGFEKLTPETSKPIIYSLLNEEQKKNFERDLRTSVSTLIGNTQLRVSVYYHLGNVEATIRLPTLGVLALSELGLPPAVEELIRRPNGLVLVTGPTCHGKTTTMNAMIDQINSERRCKIVTVEDPIELLHRPKKSIIVQQEVGTDVRNYHEALYHSLRLDPDVICVGEMRDLETITTALEAASTGHLVIATLHTNDAAQTVDRIVNAFPPHDRSYVVGQFAASLQGIVSQILIPNVTRTRRVLACELMIANEAVRNLIREGKNQNLPNVISTGKEAGMISMDNSLRSLVRSGQISTGVAMAHAKNPSYMMTEGA